MRAALSVRMLGEELTLKGGGDATPLIPEQFCSKLGVGASPDAIGSNLQMTTEELGATLGEHFAKARSLGSLAEQEAKKLIDLVIERDPKVKLPALLADERVKAWQAQMSVSDHHLKEALTRARKAIEKVVDDRPIKVPGRARNGTAKTRSTKAEAAQTAPTSHAATLPGIVPNLPLDRL